MFTLKLLGTASIEAVDGPISGRAAQGRRLALLAVLALARGRALTRDKLIGLLWPEASPDRGRPQLSDTLYVLRNALGEDVVRGMGDEVALNAAAVTSDVARFEQAVKEGRLEEAVELYRGPLLDGFHIPESVEFETWLDGERAELDRKYGRALELLAEAADTAGDHAAAVAWWRRRAVHDPFNGRVALGLMRALDAAGDRAGALQHARIHETLLREEFDAEPDAEIVALSDRLRREPAAVPLPPREPEPDAAASSRPALPPAPPLGVSAGAEPVGGASGMVMRRRRPPLGLVLAMVLVLAFAVALGLAYGARSSAEPADARSVGVLPFVNMSADPGNAYFSDGLSEQIILALSRIEGLQVAARTSSFALRNRELGVRAIGDTLGVEAVLEGSVLVAGDRLRVIAQLIDARTGYHIWSDHYDGELSDAFAVQDRIASAIAQALHLRLTRSGGPAAPARTPSLQAYDLYLRGLHLRDGLAPDGLRQAAQYFDRAIELEPRFAEAIAAKATVVAPQAYFLYTGRDSVVAQLRTLTARALELDPRNAEAYASLGILKLFYDWEWAAAEDALRRALELNPNDAHAWHHLGNYHSATGSLEDAIAARERAVQLDPLNGRYRIVLGRDLVLAGKYDAALEQGRRAAQLDPMNPLLLGLGPGLPVGAADVYLHQGRNAEAVDEYLRLATLRGATREELDAMRAGFAAGGMPAFWKAWLAMDMRQHGTAPNPVRMAFLHLLTGDTAQALDWLDRAYAERNPALIYMRRDLFSGMLDHPRVARITRGMKFPQ